MRKVVAILSFQALMVICCTSSPKQEKISVSEEIEMYDLRDRVLSSGDTAAYNELWLGHTLKFIRPWDILYYSQVMCNKYHYPGACLDIFNINNETYCPENLKSRDTFSYKLGIYYLLKSYELGYPGSKVYVNKIFKDSVPSSGEYIKTCMENNPY